jgi:hypothetical protein
MFVHIMFFIYFWPLFITENLAINEYVTGPICIAAIKRLRTYVVLIYTYVCTYYVFYILLAFIYH